MAKSKSPLGDVRLVRPFTKLLNAMSEKMTVILRQLGNDRKEEVSYGRLINNPRVTPTNLVKQYWLENQTDWSGKHLLVVEDGSTISLQLSKDRKGLGYVGESDKIGGFQVHNAIFLDANDLSCYGLGAAQVYKSEDESAEEKAERRKNRWKIPFTEKERYKWFTTASEAIKNARGAGRYTIVGDREADIYDALARFLAQGWDFVIRSSSDRKVAHQGGISTLHAVIDSWEVCHTYKLSLAATKKRSKHEAKLHLKFGHTYLMRPKSHPDKALPEQIPVYVVEVREDPATVVQGEDPVHWILLSSYEVTNVDQALQIVQWYCERWNIEQTYRTLKSEGLDIEHSEVENYRALANLTVLALMAATQIIQLVRARTGNTQQNMDCVFTPVEIKCIESLNSTLEGNTEKLKNPYPPQSLAFATWVIARLGGWSGYEKQRPPGPITFINGLTRFYDIARGFYLRL
jgi:hypothetical protein